MALMYTNFALVHSTKFDIRLRFIWCCICFERFFWLVN